MLPSRIIIAILTMVGFRVSYGFQVIWTIPSSAVGVEGQSVTITWLADLKTFASPDDTWAFVIGYQKQTNGLDEQLIKLRKDGTRTVYPKFVSRDSDLKLNVSQNGTVVEMLLTIANLNKSTDARQYTILIGQPENTEKSTQYTTLVVHVAIKITSPHPVTLTANEGQSAKLVCNATGIPTPAINWTRDGVIVHTGSPFMTAILTNKDDKACYTCIAYNGIAVPETASICLNVQYVPVSTMFTNNPSLDRFCKGNTTTFTCNATGKPPVIEYSLYRNNQLIEGKSTSGTFVVPLNDKGVNTFTCVPNNTAGIGENKSIQFFVTDPPTIVISPWNMLLLEGQDLMMFCNASGVPAPNVTWYKVGGGVVGYGETFIISNITREDEGFYRCETTNGDDCDTDSRVAHITVNYASEIIPPHLPIITVNEGQSMKLVCNATGKPPPIINWKRDGVVVGTGSPFMTPNLTHIDDETCYTCIAYNGIEDAKTDNFCLNVRQRSTTAPSKQTETQTDEINLAAIVLAVCFGLSLLLNVILIAYFVWKHKKEVKNNKRKSANEDTGYMNAIAFQDIHQSSSSYQNVPESAIDGSQQQPSNTTGTPSINSTGNLSTDATGSPSSREPVYQPLNHINTSSPYGSLSPDTKLPPKRLPDQSQASGIYQDLKRDDSDYEALDDYANYAKT